MGQKSEGMILSAEKDGVLTLVSLQMQFQTEQLLNNIAER